MGKTVLNEILFEFQYTSDGKTIGKPKVIRQHPMDLQLKSEEMSLLEAMARTGSASLGLNGTTYVKHIDFTYPNSNNLSASTDCYLLRNIGYERKKICLVGDWS